MSRIAPLSRLRRSFHLLIQSMNGLSCLPDHSIGTPLSKSYNESILYHRIFLFYSSYISIIFQYKEIVLFCKLKSKPIVLVLIKHSPWLLNGISYALTPLSSCTRVLSIPLGCCPLDTYIKASAAAGQDKWSPKSTRLAANVEGKALLRPCLPLR